MRTFIGVDVGGTFTDFSVVIPGRGEILFKAPSAPSQPDAAIVDGLRKVIALNQIDPTSVMQFAHGTTVGTNALIQRRVGKVGVITTRGFRDLLEIGRQTRPKVYDLHEDRPAPLVPRELRIEVTERVLADGRVHRPLNESEVADAGRTLQAASVDCIVVCFMHAYSFPEHETRAAAILRAQLPPAIRIITSASVYPEFREYERFSTAVLNAALLTVMDDYLDRLATGVADVGAPHSPTVSQSSGGLMSIEMARRLPVRTALSGPAAGAIGAAERAKLAGFPDVITLDVGGTSADVALITAGTPALVGSRMLAGFPLRLPSLDVNSVGAGGGSIAWIDRDGLLKVGPQSAGAVPGPACYNIGGTEATVTDANVLLGRLSDVALLDGRMAIRRDLAEAAVNRLADKLNLAPIETSLGISHLVCATMVKAIRSISVERGHDPRDFALFAFGGAGPLHATDVARALGIRRIVIPVNPGILCAQGLLNSDLVTDLVRSSVLPFTPQSGPAITRLIAELARDADAWFESEDIPRDRRQVIWSADLRYRGQNFELMIPFDAAAGEIAVDTVLTAFHASHERTYGFNQPNEPVELVSLRVQLIGLLEKPDIKHLPQAPAGKPIGTRRVLFESGAWSDAAVYRRTDLAPGQTITGPAIVEQMDSTTPIWPGDQCAVDAWGNLIITLGERP
jgi:N-methylhydantoinase A